MRTKVNRYSNLTDEQVQGANWAFRLVHTSPRIRGKALELVEDLIKESYDELNNRSEKKE